MWDFQILVQTVGETPERDRYGRAATVKSNVMIGVGNTQQQHA
jgi:hypothetical protein